MQDEFSEVEPFVGLYHMRKTILYKIGEDVIITVDYTSLGSYLIKKNNYPKFGQDKYKRYLLTNSSWVQEFSGIEETDVSL